MKKRYSAAVILILMLVTICRAASEKRNDSDHAHRCSDGPEKSLIGDMEADEYSMDSDVGRRLLQVNTGQAVTAGTGNASQAAVACGNQRYAKCLPNPNSPPAGTNCGIYNRECP